MSTIETENQTPYLDALADVADGSTISDPEALHEIAEGLTKTLKQGVSDFRRWAGVTTKVGIARVQARMLILTSKGTPDWSAQSDAYRVTIGAAEAEVWASCTADEKRKNDAAVRQQIARKLLEPMITDYVLKQMSDKDLSEDQRRGLKWAEVTGTTLTVLIGEIPAKLKQALAAQYKSANLTVPEKFGGPARGSGQDSRSDKDPASAQTALETVAVSLAKSGEDGGPSFLSGIAGIHATASAYLLALNGASEVQDRPEVTKVAADLSAVVALIGKTLDGKVTPEEIEAAPLYVAAK